MHDNDTIELVPATSGLRTSPTIGKLAEALAKAQDVMEGATKDSTNPHFKSRYADLAAVRDACRPLSKVGIAVLQPTKASGAQVTVTTMLVHSSGEWIAEDLTLTAQQATPQAVGSAITYGRRYGLAAMAGIAPEDDDGEAAEGRGNGQAKRVQPALQPAPNGYDKWLTGFHAAAKKGLDPLRQAFKAAPEPYREYLTRHDGVAYEKAKADAETASKNAAATA